MTHIPYKGGSPALNDVIGGRVQAMFANLPEVLAQVEAGRLRPLAVTGEMRHPALPNVPTFAESGYAQMQAKSWFGLFVPATTPAPVVAKLSAAIAKSVTDPVVQKQLKDLGADPIGNTNEVFQPFVAEEVKRWGALVTRSGATAD
jgi:tripartite-type tricarboxylate transporter receptor subunit TctC